MNIKADEGRMHFSPAIKDWAECDATQKKCQYDHITTSEYNTLVAIQEQEGTLLNSSLGKAEISYIQAKTSMTTEEIQNMLRELRREGSIVTKPTENEILNFIEKERFKVENDASLTTKEKRAILKNLKQAEKDLKEQGHQVSGGVFHAWKNGIATAFNRIKKPLLAGALIGSLSFGLAACAPSNDAKAPEKESTSNSQTVEQKEACEDTAVTGDVVLGDKAKSVDGGVYCTLKPNFDGKLNDYSSAVVAPSVYEGGYTDSQLAEVQVAATHKLIENIMSTPVTGQSTEQTLKWVQSQKDTFRPELIESFSKEEVKNGHTNYGILLSSKEVLPPVVNDGGAQITDAKVEVKVIEPRKNADGVEDASSGVAVTFNTTTTYRVDASKYKEWRKGFLTNAGLSDYVNTVDEEGQDLTKPLFIDQNRTVTVIYDASDIKDNMSDAKIRSLFTKTEDLNNVIAYNK